MWQFELVVRRSNSVQLEGTCIDIAVRPIMQLSTAFMALPVQYFQKLVESCPDIIISVDKNGKIIFYNDGARQNLGFSFEEVLGKSVLRSEEHTSELQSRRDLVCRLLLE